VDGRISPRPAPLAVELVQGAHLVLQEAVEKGCYYMEAPQDRRATFLLPWGEHALLGTTEHSYRGEPHAVEVLDSERAYLLEVLHHYFPGRSPAVVESFAGLRTLPAAGHAAFNRSREIRLPVDNSRRPRVLSIYGGKLTGYRATAGKVMQKIRRSLPERKVLARTDTLMLTPVD
jgi:glycerol-3-phosphate dehydrogenase